MRVRYFAKDDFDRCLELGQMMHEESDFRVHPFCPDKVVTLATLCLSSENFVCFVAETDQDIVGMFVGLAGDHYFSEAKYASDMLLYVEPRYRGSSAAIRLMSAFEDWAVEQGCHEIRVGAATGIEPERSDRFFKGIGYTPSGIQYLKAIGPLSAAH
jgi:GNAT superfamily N-acetyltransferase